MDKSWKLLHDSRDQVSVVSETNMNVVALHNLFSVVQAHMESSINTVDSDVFSLVSDIFSVGDCLTSTGVGSVATNGSLIIELSSLGEGHTRK